MGISEPPCGACFLEAGGPLSGEEVAEGAEGGEEVSVIAGDGAQVVELAELERR